MNGRIMQMRFVIRPEATAEPYQKQILLNEKPCAIMPFRYGADGQSLEIIASPDCKSLKNLDGPRSNPRQGLVRFEAILNAMDEALAQLLTLVPAWLCPESIFFEGNQARLLSFPYAPEQLILPPALEERSALVPWLARHYRWRTDLEDELEKLWQGERQEMLKRVVAREMRDETQNAKGIGTLFKSIRFKHEGELDATRELATDWGSALAVLEEAPAYGKKGLERRVILGQEFLIGRDSLLCDLILSEATIGRTHARITRHGTNFFIEDLGSRNGSTLNGQKLKKGFSTPLPDHCRLDFGGRSFTFISH